MNHDAHFRDNNTAHKAPSLLQPWGATGVHSAADPLQTNDSVHERTFPIPCGCINASVTTTSKEIPFSQIPRSPPLHRHRQWGRCKNRVPLFPPRQQLSCLLLYRSKIHCLWEAPNGSSPVPKVSAIGSGHHCLLDVWVITACTGESCCSSITPGEVG